MENPDPTKFILITDYVAALQLQQAAFDLQLAAKVDIETELALKSALLTAAEAAVLDPTSDREALNAVKAVIADSKRPERDKQIEEIDARIAELQAKRAELSK